jgi:hypothetical protein
MADGMGVWEACRPPPAPWSAGARFAAAALRLSSIAFCARSCSSTAWERRRASSSPYPFSRREWYTFWMSSAATP